eukprot:TRINITY_DN618_c0_g2_i7.p1 TRINITY_DN618_c0_g2~~TRINITY_DN618_c0_g2_i7.p1  ORF type:complete len:381 (+),score=116.36 TRINITY_DN618_c0_g2_i7:311-1453(+)
MALVESANGVMEAPMCSVCYEDLQDSTRGITDICEHLFCFPCIYDWSKITNTCPMCKRRFQKLTKISPDGSREEFEIESKDLRPEDYMTEDALRDYEEEEEEEPDDDWIVYDVDEEEEEEEERDDTADGNYQDESDGERVSTSSSRRRTRSLGRVSPTYLDSIMKEEEEEEEEEINEEGEGRQRRKSATRKTSTRAQKRKSKNTARTSQKKRKVTRKMGEASSSSSSSSSTADSAQEAEKRRMDKVFEKAWQVFETLRRNPQLATRRSRAAPAITTVVETPTEAKPRKRPGVSQFAQGLLTSGLPDYLLQPSTSSSVTSSPSTSTSSSPSSSSSSSSGKRDEKKRSTDRSQKLATPSKRKFSESSDRNGNANFFVLCFKF